MNPSDSFAPEAPMHMTHGTSAADMFGGYNFGIGMFIFQIIVWGFYAYCQYTLSKKMNIKYSWMAWIPVLNGINLLWIAGKSLPKYIILSLLFFFFIIGGPILAFSTGIIALSILSTVGIFGLLGLSLAVFDGVARRTGHGFFWALGLLILYFIMFPITAFTYIPSENNGVDGNDGKMKQD